MQHGSHLTRQAVGGFPFERQSLGCAGQPRRWNSRCANFEEFSMKTNLFGIQLFRSALLSAMLLISSCGPAPVAKFVAEAGPVEVSISVDLLGNVYLSTGYNKDWKEISIAKIGPVGLKFALEGAIQLTAEKKYQLNLIVLASDAKGEIVRSIFEIGKKFKIKFATCDQVQEIRGDNDNVFVSVQRLPDASNCPEDWHLDFSEIDNNLSFVSRGAVSNQDFANGFENPEEAKEILANTDKWKRIVGYSSVYVNKDSCQTKEGIVQAKISTAVFKNSSGALLAWEWFVEWRRKAKDVTQMTSDKLVGDATVTVWSVGKNTCNPPNKIKILQIRFQKDHGIGIIDLQSIDGRVEDKKLLSLATEIAKKIESKMIKSFGASK